MPYDAATESLPHPRSVEVDGNYVVFLRLLPRPLPDYRGKYALMRSGRIVGMFWDGYALRAGHEEFGDEPFSVQRVTDEPDYIYRSSVFQGA